MPHHEPFVISEVIFSKVLNYCMIDLTVCALQISPSRIPAGLCDLTAACVTHARNILMLYRQEKSLQAFYLQALIVKHWDSYEFSVLSGNGLRTPSKLQEVSRFQDLAKLARESRRLIEKGRHV